MNKYLRPETYVRRCRMMAVKHCVTPLFMAAQKQTYLRLSNEPLSHQPLFIIGAPRTGSTILYQALTNFYDLLFLDNLACRTCYNLYFALWLSEKKFSNRPHNNFEAKHGDTDGFGAHSPSECGDFWYRWLPRDRHFIEEDEIAPIGLDAIRREVTAAINFGKKPLLFKNLNAGMRLRLLAKAFPNAKFIFIRRDPRFVVRSIAKARKSFGIPSGAWWSVMPPNVAELIDLPELELCAAQVYFIERQIEEDLKRFAPENIVEVHYRQLSADCIEDLGPWIGASRRPGGSLPSFRKDMERGLPAGERQELQSAVDRYPFHPRLFG